MPTHAPPAHLKWPKYSFIKGWLYIVSSHGISRIAAWPNLLFQFHAISSADKRKTYSRTGESPIHQILWGRNPEGPPFSQRLLFPDTNLSPTPELTDGWQTIQPGNDQGLDERIRWIKKHPDELSLMSSADGSYVLPGGTSALTGMLAIHEFQKSIPADVKQMAEQFKSHHWQLMKLMSIGPEAINLMRSTPLLAYMLVNVPRFWSHVQHRNTEPVLKVLRMRQRDIADYLHFPPSEMIVKILRKIRPNTVNPVNLNALPEILLMNPAYTKHLAHQPRINAGLFALITSPKDMLQSVGRELLLEVNDCEAEKDNPHTAFLLGETVAMYRILLRPHGELPVFKSIRRLRQEHDRLLKLYLACKGKTEHQRFPLPPFPGTNAIVPITTPYELSEEGRAQHNCAGTYSGAVAKGGTYFYKVLKPERATLMINRWAGGTWHKDQLRLSCNNDPGAETIQHVDEWLEAMTYWPMNSEGAK